MTTCSILKNKVSLSVTEKYSRLFSNTYLQKKKRNEAKISRSYCASSVVGNEQVDHQSLNTEVPPEQIHLKRMRRMKKRKKGIPKQ